MAAEWRGTLQRRSSEPHMTRMAAGNKPAGRAVEEVEGAEMAGQDEQSGGPGRRRLRRPVRAVRAVSTILLATAVHSSHGETKPLPRTGFFQETMAWPSSPADVVTSRQTGTSSAQRGSRGLGERRKNNFLQSGSALACMELQGRGRGHSTNLFVRPCAACLRPVRAVVDVVWASCGVHRGPTLEIGQSDGARYEAHRWCVCPPGSAVRGGRGVLGI